MTGLRSAADRRSTRSDGRDHVRPGKLIAFKKQGLAGFLGKGVGETVAEIELGGMKTLSEPALGGACTLSGFSIDGHNLGLNLDEQPIGGG